MIVALRPLHLRDVVVGGEEVQLPPANGLSASIVQKGFDDGVPPLMVSQYQADCSVYSKYRKYVRHAYIQLDALLPKSL